MYIVCIHTDILTCLRTHQLASIDSLLQAPQPLSFLSLGLSGVQFEVLTATLSAFSVSLKRKRAVYSWLVSKTKRICNLLVRESPRKGGFGLGFDESASALASRSRFWRSRSSCFLASTMTPNSGDWIRHVVLFSPRSHACSEKRGLRP